MKVKNGLLSGIIILFFFTGCIHINLFEKQAAIPSTGWAYGFQPEFTFQIKDTTAQYMVYIVVRHSDQYQYNNLWINLKTKAPTDTAKNQNINLQLATSNQWEGTGINDIYEVRKLISNGPVIFRNAGDYIFTVSQIMRDNPLKHIFNIGIRVEKVN